VNSILRIQTPEAITLIEKIKAELKKRAEAKAKRIWLRKPKSWRDVEAGTVNAFTFLHHWIGSGVADHVDRAGSQPGLHLVLCALQTPRNLFGSAYSRDVLFLRAADGEWPGIRPQCKYSSASHPPFRIACNGDESSEWKFCYRGD
jgi:hypothetical protein